VPDDTPSEARLTSTRVHVLTVSAPDGGTLTDAERPTLFTVACTRNVMPVEEPGLTKNLSSSVRVNRKTRKNQV
jgi:hypothetical protein